ncbi:GNAT family N-acetyltransferase [Hazenella sp. IB182353]|uniref:GNAT family N-acetyltransferase n=1 Tax=Polycladospora coralii TaxID=2771432 RepID=UPI0017462290|nr:GNAT family N-acetyltransferase [Polycladospora coralii]
MLLPKETEFPLIEINNFYLKVLTLADAEVINNHFSDEHITKYLDIEPCKDIEQAVTIIQYHMEDAGCRWGIFTKEDDTFIGTCGFHYLRNSNNIFTAEIGFDLSRDQWGKGIMFEVLQQIIAFGFTQMGLDVIDATVEQANERSQKLMNKLGFQRASELRENLVYYYLSREKKRINKIR